MSQGGGDARGYIRSPDGRWWWDGERWRPVAAPPPRGTGTGGRWLIAAVIVLILAVPVPLGITAVAIALRAGHARPPSGPPASAPFATDLADASVTGIELAATSHGLQCGPPPLHVEFGPAPPMHFCHHASRGELLSVQTLGRDSSHVSAVHVDAFGLRPADEPATLALFQAVLGAAVAGPDAAPDEGWLSAHFDEAGTNRTTLDGVALLLTVNGSQRSLSIQPATI